MKKSVVYTIFAILLVLVAVLAYLFLSQRKEMNEMVEQMTIEKEELEDCRTFWRVSNNVCKTCWRNCVPPRLPMPAV